MRAGAEIRRPPEDDIENRQPEVLEACYLEPHTDLLAVVKTYRPSEATPKRPPRRLAAMRWGALGVSYENLDARHRRCVGQ